LQLKRGGRGCIKDVCLHGFSGFVPVANDSHLLRSGKILLFFYQKN